MKSASGITHLIVNSPYDEPKHHWHYPHVTAWAKNDHLGFEIAYIFAGIFHKFRPDYLVRLAKGTNVVLETKGQNTPQDETKRRYLDEWVKAVNEHGGFGKWKTGLCLNPSDLPTVIHSAISA